MPAGRPKKVERNNEIIEKKKLGWSYRRIAQHYRISVSWVHKIHHRETDGIAEIPEVMHS